MGRQRLTEVMLVVISLLWLGMIVHLAMNQCV